MAKKRTPMSELEANEHIAVAAAAIKDSWNKGAQTTIQDIMEEGYEF